MSDYYNQDRIDKSAEERREGLNVLRFLLVFIFLVPVALGTHMVIDRVAFPVSETTGAQETISGGDCLIVPALIFVVTIISLLLRGIFGSFAERREHQRLVRARHDLERAMKPKPEAPIRQEPKAKVLHAPAKKQPVDLSPAAAYQKEVDERRARQSIHAKLMAAKREAARQREEQDRKLELEKRINNKSIFDWDQK